MRVVSAASSGVVEHAVSDKTKSVSIMSTERNFVFIKPPKDDSDLLYVKI